MTTRNFRRAFVLWGVSTLMACGGGASNDLSAPSIKLWIQNEAPLSACASGGVTVHSGVDTNQDLVLQNPEVTGTQYICNGNNGVAGLSGFNGLAGTSGLSALVVVSGELPGANCVTGGTQVSAGFDANQDQTLNAGEVTSSNYICNGIHGNAGSSGNVGSNGTSGLNGINGAAGNNGAAGTDGINGAAGATGFKSLVTIVTELPGIHCLTGGVVAKSGVDINSNNSLDPAEVTSTTYICNGERGATGATGGTGAQGETGAIGPAGGGLSAYGYIYAVKSQEVAVDAAVLFDGQGELHNIRYDIATSVIHILQNGNYRVSFSITGIEPNQFAILVDEKVVPGSIYGSGAGTQQNNGQVIVSLEKGNMVTLVNYHSAAAVQLVSPSGGTAENVVASITLLQLN